MIIILNLNKFHHNYVIYKIMVLIFMRKLFLLNKIQVQFKHNFLKDIYKFWIK